MESGQEASKISGSEGESDRSGAKGSDSAGDASADQGQEGRQRPDTTSKDGRDSTDDGENERPSAAASEPDGTEKKPSSNAEDSGQAKPSADADPGEMTERGAAGASRGVPEGGGIPNDSASRPDDLQHELAEADAANLEYAKEATDLVLERLKDQRKDPEPELLESLGWSEEELRAFVARWEAMKRDAREQDGEAARDLEDALRSLGLRPSGPERRAADAEDDTLRGLQDGGGRSRPPAELLEQFNAYRKGVARGQRNGG